MTRFLSLAQAVLLIGSVLAGASTLISKQEAEQDAIVAVGGGTVTQILKEKELGKIIWSVDVVDASNEYEVWLDAHTGATLRIITQALSEQASAGQSSYISKQRAEQDALKEVGAVQLCKPSATNRRATRSGMSPLPSPDLSTKCL